MWSLVLEPLLQPRSGEMSTVTGNGTASIINIYQLLLGPTD